MTAGYSGTPLAQKLSLKPNMRVWFDEMPPHVLAEIDMPELVRLPRPNPASTPRISSSHAMPTWRPSWRCCAL